MGKKCSQSWGISSCFAMWLRGPAIRKWLLFFNLLNLGWSFDLYWWFTTLDCGRAIDVPTLSVDFRLFSFLFSLHLWCPILLRSPARFLINEWEIAWIRKRSPLIRYGSTSGHPSQFIGGRNLKMIPSRMAESSQVLKAWQHKVEWGFFFFYHVLGTEPRALLMLSKHSTTELHPSLKLCIVNG